MRRGSTKAHEHTSSTPPSQSPRHFFTTTPRHNSSDSYPPKWWWTWINPPPWSISVGGIVVLASSVVFLGCFIHYWAHDHLYQSGTNMSNNEIRARFFGQCSNMIMGLLLFPVSKNSILTSCFGIAWEQGESNECWLLVDGC